MIQQLSWKEQCWLYVCVSMLGFNGMFLIMDIITKDIAYHTAWSVIGVCSLSMVIAHIIIRNRKSLHAKGYEGSK